MESRIRILPDRVVNQIAAGEVIERPAAVVKELVENALDAGATRIEVEFQESGRALIRVEDNGAGMSRDDALLALERHATSKLAETNDLDRLSTFGFRGEALPSIASVARFTLQTRAAASEAGTEVVVNGGKLVHVRECGRAVGTNVAVAQLFHPVPARRKFLKSDGTEAGHIIQCVRLYALASPAVAFTLAENGRIIFRSPECPTLAERVAEIFGEQLTELLVSIEAVEAGFRLKGLIGRPGSARTTRHEMVTFVNGRPVDSRALNFALIEAYRESVPKGRYPLAFLFFECDPAAVDVNVHPAKREVRFRNETAVRGFVIRSVLARLREIGATAAPAGLPNPGATGLGEAASPYGILPEWGTAPAGTSAVKPAGVGAFPEAGPAEIPTLAPADSPTDQARNWRFLGLAHGVYGLFETPSGLVLFDRAAAHERIWFERLQKEFRAEKAPSQRLLLPVAVELDPISSALLLERRSFLEAHGFGIAEFGRGFFRIEAIPGWMEPVDAEAFLREVVGALRDGRLAGDNLDLAREDLARLASRSVRLSPAPGASEMQSLLADLFATRSPLTNPAGRPTLIEINRSELARRFQKT